jgi:DNA-binding IclR family transcriptional regulator
MTSFKKVFTVLETVIAHQDTGLSFSDVAVKTELPSASVHRALKGLVDLGYLNFNPETKRYRGALKVASLGSEVVGHFNLREHARPYLLNMHRDTGHTCNMGIKNGDIGIHIDKVETQEYGIKLCSEVGKSFPLHCTGMGKALLAWSPDEEVKEVLDKPLEVFTDKTISDPEEIKALLKKIREQGYSLDDEEISRGMMCVAAPVFGIDGHLIAAISVSFPTYVFTERGLDPEIKCVKHYATAIGGAVE